jgi:hypothetical protein
VRALRGANPIGHTRSTLPNPHRKIPKSRPLLTPNPLRQGVYDPLQDDEVKVNLRVPGIERIEPTA